MARDSLGTSHIQTLQCDCASLAPDAAPLVPTLVAQDTVNVESDSDGDNDNPEQGDEGDVADADHSGSGSVGTESAGQCIDLTAE